MRLYTTTEAARMLGVGPSTVKRWADDGVLECIKTAGGHRRFPAEAIRRFEQEGRDEARLGYDVWFDLLLGSVTSPYEIHSALLQARASEGSWWRVAQQITQVVSELDLRRDKLQVSQLQFQIAAERLQRSLAFIVQNLPSAPSAPAILLLSMHSDMLTSVELGLAEICVKETGCQAIWGGPLCEDPADIVDAVQQYDAHIVLVCSGLVDSPEPSESDHSELFAELNEVLKHHQTQLLVFGTEEYSEDPIYGAAAKDFGMLNQVLEKYRSLKKF